MAVLTIVDYEERYQPHFERLNRAWIEKYFSLEDIDKYVLTKPQEAIMANGGHIFMALYDNQVAGTVALKKVDDNTYEFTKMAVDETFQRRGIAEALSHAAIHKARKSGATRIILYSQTALMPALHLYQKLGFKRVPIEPGIYKRADIKMELWLQEQHTLTIKL
ncbi:MAG: GNAT family N-acetyltransferase [Flavisolibacter sp.]|nr:GNAT family N-acetyltransferase [Flavisolibacter sp.]MBD0378002.1 GNAT family N-acetyltransferase [Flavisolibacter sp.]